MKKDMKFYKNSELLAEVMSILYYLEDNRTQYKNKKISTTNEIYKSFYPLNSKKMQTKEQLIDKIMEEIQSKNVQVQVSYELRLSIKEILEKHLNSLTSEGVEHQCERIIERKIWPLWEPVKTWRIICCKCKQHLNLPRWWKIELYDW